jgi:cobalt-zinc-cadmium efflux system membrane fusion protein
MVGSVLLGCSIVQESLQTISRLEAARPAEVGAAPSLLGRLGQTVPALLVFSALGSLLAWGHQTGWTFPRFSSLSGAAPEVQDDWCSQHSVPDSRCVECNPDLLPRPKAHGWCKRHGVHECPLCHPEVAQTASPPSVTEADLRQAQRALDLTDRPENNPSCKLHQRRIQLASLQAMAKAGIEPDPVRQVPIVEAVAGSGELVYDQTLTARLSARTSGTVFRALKKVGDPVAQGEVVALVEAAEVGKAKADLVQALVQVRLKTRNLDAARESKAVIPDRTYRELETDLSEARIRLSTAQQALANLALPIDADRFKEITNEQLADRLRFHGLPPAVLPTLEASTATANLLPVTAPFSGVVVAREAVAGEVIDNHKVLFVVVDVRKLWLMLDLRLEDIRLVALGLKVHFRPDGAKEEVAGVIDWISTEIDHKTRTIKVRAVLDNADGQLRSNTFGTGRVIVREEPRAVVVPNEAIHWEGDCHIVFVQDRSFLKVGAPKVFHTRTVRLGVRDHKQTEIIAGLMPGEVVAARGSAALRAELLRGSLGEG